MKGIAWLITGLMLALLLVSGVSVGSRLSLSNYFPLTQDLKSIGQISHQTLIRANQGFKAQKTFLNNSATVVTTWDLVFGWISPVIDWLGDLWFNIVEAWRRFLGLSSNEPELAEITPAMREQLKRELLAELESQGLLDFSSSAENVSGIKYGVTVVPSTGSTTSDELLKKNLNQMFADQVRLRFDRDGLTGVVTPIFRDGSEGSDYIFVLSPIP